MKNTFQRIPEVLLADSTHKSNDSHMLWFALMAVDGYGDSRVVAAFLVSSEDEVTLTDMLKLFTDKNPASSPPHRQKLL